MAKIIKQIQLSTNTIVNSKELARRELANVMAKPHFSKMLNDLSDAKNPSSLNIEIDKHKELLKSYIDLMYETEEIDNLII